MEIECWGETFESVKKLAADPRCGVSYKVLARKIASGIFPVQAVEKRKRKTPRRARPKSWDQAPRAGQLKGVRYWGKKWQARIEINGKTVHLGRFETAEEAARAYNKAVDDFRDGEGYKNPI